MIALVIADDELLVAKTPDVRADILISCGDLPDELILEVAARVGRPAGHVQAGAGGEGLERSAGRALPGAARAPLQFVPRLLGGEDPGTLGLETLPAYRAGLNGTGMNGNRLRASRPRGE